MHDTYTLILVGGTGQRLGLMLGYLNVLGLAVVPRYVVVIDADDQHRERLTRLLTFGNTDVSVSFQKPFALTATDAKVSSLVSSTGSKFWDICMEPGDRDMPIDQGFYARPQVASVVFNASMAQPDKFTLFHAITKGISQAGGVDSTVVIAGSIAGGTGAGIIPTLARQLRREGKNKVVGILFSRYFRVAGVTEGRADQSFAPDNEMLEANSNAGFEHIRGLLKQRDCPFNAVYILGHHPQASLAEACAHEDFQPHAFPGMLAAATLLADGSREIDGCIAASQTDDGGEQPKLYLFPSGPLGQLEENQVPVKLPNQGLPLARTTRADSDTEVVGAATLRQVLRVSRAAVSQFDRMPFSASLGRLATFPRQRLTPAVYDTLLERSALSPGEADVLAQAVHEAASQHAFVVDRLRDWFGSLADWRESPNVSTAVQPVKWRAAIGRQTRELQVKAIAERWVQAISRSQIGSAKSAEPSSIEGKDFLLPIQSTGGHDKAPCKPMKVSPDAIEASPAVGDNWQKLSTSFARPDGRREAFSIAVHQGRVAAAVEFEWELWQFLAAGLMGLEVVDCLAGPADGFDRTMHQSSGQRFHLRLHAADRAGLGLGGLSATDGIWPGVLSEPVQNAFKGMRDALRGRAWELAELQDIANPSVALRAALVLSIWCEDVTAQSAQTPNLPWLRSVQDRARQAVRRACDQTGGRVAPEQLRAVMVNHLASVGPLQIHIGGKQIPLYLYQFDAWRRCRVLLLQRGLESGGLSRNGAEVIAVNAPGDSIAQIQLAPPVPRAGQNAVSLEDVLMSGYGRLRFTGALPMASAGDHARTPWLKWPNLLHFNQGAYDSLVHTWQEARESAPPPTSPFAVDLFWNVMRADAAEARNG